VEAVHAVKKAKLYKSNWNYAWWTQAQASVSARLNAQD